MKNPLTPTGMEPATFRFVAQHLNHCTTAAPLMDTCTRQKGKVALVNAMKAYREMEVVYPPAHTLTCLTHHTAAHFPVRPVFNACSSLRQPVAVNAARVFSSAVSEHQHILLQLFASPIIRERISDCNAFCRSNDPPVCTVGDFARHRNACCLWLPNFCTCK
jgi:hypothetical protein